MFSIKGLVEMGVGFAAGPWVPSVSWVQMDVTLAFVLEVSTSAGHISSVPLFHLIWCTWGIRDREICVLRLIWKLHC